MNPPLSPAALSARIVREARALGFHRVGIAPAAPAAGYGAYRDWLEAGFFGEMAYMAAPAHVAGRADPRRLLEAARSVVVVALAYAGPDADRDRASRAGPGPGSREAVRCPDMWAGAATTAAAPGRRPACAGPGHAGSPADAPDAPRASIRGFVARYARGRDYHGVMKRRLHALADAIGQAIGRPVAARPCVDTAPVLERDLCAAGGLGFLGKNTMLITPGLGSYVLLGELLLDVDAAPTADAPPRERCGECRACLDACPTSAFVGEWVLDARRCVSYLTIEHHGAIPRALRRGVGVRIFGCDACQDVCPFNARAPGRHAPDPELSPGPADADASANPSDRRPGDPADTPGVAADASLDAFDRGAPDLLALLGATESRRKRWVDGTALRRASRDMLLRNACVALGNAGDPRAIEPLTARLADRSPLVRGHAAWALGQLGALEPLHVRLPDEPHPEVRAEIEAALADVIRPRRTGTEPRP